MKRFYSVFLALFLLSAQSIFALGSSDVLIERVSAPHFYLETSNPLSYTGAAANTPRTAYVAFKVTNVSATTLNGLKAKLNTFLMSTPLPSIAGTLGLVNSTTTVNLETQDIGKLAPGQSDVLYWLVQYPKQASTTSGPLGCKMTITITDLNPGNASLCESPGITMRTMVTSGAGFSTSLASCTRTVRPVVGAINEVIVTYNFSSVSSGDEINLQPVGNLSFLASCFQLTNMKIETSNVPGVNVGDTDKIYYTSTGSVTNGSIRVRYYFNNIGTVTTSATPSTTINPYTTQSNSVTVSGTTTTTTVYPTNYLNSAVSTTFSLYNTLPFSVVKTSLNHSPAPGAAVGYKVVIKNNSSYRTSFHKIEDVMPRGFTFIGTSAGDVNSSTCSVTPPAGVYSSTGSEAISWEGFVSGSVFPFKEFVVNANDSVELYYQTQVPMTTGVNKLFVNTVKIYFGRNYFTAPVTANVCVNCTDIDGDAVFDMEDSDDDNDGVQDNYEICGGCYGTNPMGDDDDDTHLNYEDINTQGYVDVNQDNVNDNWDFDLDGIINTLDRDSDNDGVSDLVEAGGLDANSDGIVDAFADDNHNGVTNLYDADYIYGIPIATLDSDHDGRYNYLDMDSDYDGVIDLIEAGYTDTNGDRKIDGTINGNGICTCVLGTLSKVETGVDVDFDYIPNTYTKGDFDGDGKPDFMDIDSDGDGIADLLETQTSSSSLFDIYDGLNVPTGTDLNHNGVDDVFDVTPTVAENSDGPGTDNALANFFDDMPDYLDTDSDNDGICDCIEGMDSDYNGVTDIVPSGSDTDQDGLDEAFDGFNLFGAVGAVAQDNIKGNLVTLDADVTLPLPNRLWRTTGTPLPVILRDLKATPAAKSILVSWNTLSEVNSDYFTVERSVDGNSFDALGNVDAVGSLNKKTAYSFDDKNTIAEDILTVYYRLKMVDKNGASRYSDKVSVALTASDLALSVFPNPTNNELNVQYYLKEVSDVTLSVYNVTGKEVYSNTVAGGQMLQNAKIDVSTFPTGVYSLKIKNAGGSKVVKFIVE